MAVIDRREKPEFSGGRRVNKKDRRKDTAVREWLEKQQCPVLNPNSSPVWAWNEGLRYCIKKGFKPV